VEEEQRRAIGVGADAASTIASLLSTTLAPILEELMAAPALGSEVSRVEKSELPPNFEARGSPA